MSARLFAALELPGSVRTQLADFGRAAAGNDEALRPVAEDSLHLTLAFLGHRALEEVDPAREAVRSVEAVAPPLALGGALWLAPRRPHVLTVALEEGDGTLAALRADVVDRLAAAVPWRPEERPFRPHVTVARVRRGWRPRVRDLPDPPQASFSGEAVVLFRSHLGGGPARYEALERVALSRISD
ncbi:MAG TPA: RNA 2',3'-cyclic phosphodiesterase [Solirubrobacteraceae bacterium]|nr:RNA 2',3'-cyclic phosphodiesterase [Solirubrobacteraceae bacterium]